MSPARLDEWEALAEKATQLGALSRTIMSAASTEAAVLRLELAEAAPALIAALRQALADSERLRLESSINGKYGEGQEDRAREAEAELADARRALEALREFAQRVADMGDQDVPDMLEQRRRVTLGQLTAEASRALAASRSSSPATTEATS